MKKYRIIYTSLLILILTAINFSCTDEFLEQPAIGAYDESVLADEDGVYGLLVGCYSQLNGTNNGFSGLLSAPWSHLLGTVRGGEALVGTEAGDGSSWEPFAQWNLFSTTPFITNVFQHYYNAVSMTNQLILLIPQVEGYSDDDKNALLAEARFLRGHFYFMLKRLWGNVPWIDETHGLDVKQPNTVDNDGVSYVDIWDNIEADMQFAADNLPATQSVAGRANSWAAKAYLVKIRLEQEKYDATTYDLCVNVVNNGQTAQGEKYGLMPKYHDNFDPEQENNKENVFQVQISVNGYSDGAWDWFSGDNTYNLENVWMSFQRTGSPGYGRGWGYIAPSQWFVDKFRVDAATGLPYLDYYSTNSEPVKNDYGLASSDAFEPETKPLDPRLDWVVGRRGIPYLDWGVMPGVDWMRDATGLYNGPYIHKKMMYYEAYEGVHNKESTALNAINGHVIRFADVLLWAAELEVRVNNNLTAAAGYVDQVRTRMQNTEGWVMNEAGDDFAANYQIGLYGTFASSSQALDAILFERSLELGFEGSRFYDVIRFGSEYVEKELNDYTEFQSQYTSYMRNITFDETDQFLPFDQTTIINSQVEGEPTITQNPGYN